jgi:NAD+ diphosphatase
MMEMEQQKGAQLFLFCGSDLLVREGADGLALPAAEELPEWESLLACRHELEPVGGRPTIAGQLPDGFTPPPGMRLEGLRRLYGQLDQERYRMAGRAAQIVGWDRSYQFCSRCGTALRPKADERAKECPHCSRLFFPRLDPAIIVLIRRGDELLLARSPHFPSRFYSTLAGFVEPGETLEEAVHREVMEEVGITITDLRYFGSQPWPFPHSLMIGFTARYAGGEIRFDSKEIEDARWFHLDRLPEIPPPLSIARRLIDWAVSQPRSGAE